MTAPKLIKVIVLTTLVIGVALILSAVCSEIQGASNTAPPRFGKLGSAIVSREVHRLSLPFDHRAVAFRAENDSAGGRDCNRVNPFDNDA